MNSKPPENNRNRYNSSRNSNQHRRLVLLRARGRGQGGHHPNEKRSRPVQLGDIQHRGLLPGHHSCPPHPPGYLLPQEPAEQPEGQAIRAARHRAFSPSFDTRSRAHPDGIPTIPPVRGQLCPSTSSERHTNGRLPNCPSNRLSAQGSHICSSIRHPGRRTRYARGQLRV